MKMNTAGFLFKTAPYGSSRPREGLDIVFLSATFEQDVELYFIEDGILNLTKRQQDSISHLKSQSKTFASLPLYDIEKLYVCEQSLKEYRLVEQDLVVPVTLLPLDDITKQFSEREFNLVF